MKTRRILLIALAVAFLLAFTGCSTKKAILADQFSGAFEGTDYRMIDYSAQFGEGMTVLGAVRYDEGEIPYEIRYYAMASMDYGKSTYETYRVTFEQNDADAAKQSDADGENYASYGLLTSDKYYYTAYIDDTVIVVEGAPAAYAGEIEGIIKKLGY